MQISTATTIQYASWLEARDRDPTVKCLGNIALIPVSVVTSTADTLIGIAYAAGGYFTLGTDKKIYAECTSQLKAARDLIPYAYTHLFRAMNPSFSYGTYNQLEDMSAKTDGLMRDHIRRYFSNSISRLSLGDNFFERQVLTRFSFALMGIASVVAAVADFLLMPVCVGMSVLTLGHISSINQMAFRTLQFMGVIDDLFKATIGVLNPSAGR